MKIEYTLEKITGKNKSLCVGDLIRYYGETRYKIIEGIQKLNDSKTTKGMVAKLLSKVTDNAGVEMIMANLEQSAKKTIFSFDIDGVNPLLYDNGNDSCIIVIELGEEYFSAKAIYDMMKPGFRKMTFEEHIQKEKDNWMKWFEKNLKDYTSCYNIKILEK